MLKLRGLEEVIMVLEGTLYCMLARNWRRVEHKRQDIRGLQSGGCYILEEDVGSEVEQVVRKSLAKEMHPEKGLPRMPGWHFESGSVQTNVKRSWQERSRG